MSNVMRCVARSIDDIRRDATRIQDALDSLRMDLRRLEVKVYGSCTPAEEEPRQGAAPVEGKDNS